MLLLDRNEYYFQHPTAVLEALSHVNHDMRRYAPVESHESLKNTVASVSGVSPSLVTLGHGAEDLLTKVLCWKRLFASKLYVSDFSWQNYDRIALGLCYELCKVPVVEQNASIYTDLQWLFLRLANESSPVVVLLTTPNNPTGHRIPYIELKKLATQFPQHMFLFDCVYDEPNSSSLQLGNVMPNVISFASFSKFFGLPGLRLGYTVGKLPSSFELALGLSAHTIYVALEVVKHIELYHKNYLSMLKHAADLRDLSVPGCTVFVSEAPFVLVRLAAPKVGKSLLVKGCPALLHAEEISGVRPKVFEHENQTYLRWGLGDEIIFNQIKSYLYSLQDIFSKDVF